MRFGLIVPALVLSVLSACDSSEPLPLNETVILEQNQQEQLELQQQLELETLVEPVLGAATGTPAEIGSWGPVLDWPHVAVSMATLPDGQVLTYSGSERRTWPTTEQTYSAVWNPATGVFQENLHQGHNMFCAAMSMTSDGQVLVNGGRNQGNSPWTTLFDYKDGEWQTIENMASGGRWYPTSLATGSGQVLTAMGTSTNTRNPDLWDPDSGWRVLNGIDFLNMRQRNNELGRVNAFPLLSQAPNGNIFHYWDTVENHLISPLGNGEARPANATTDGDNHAGGVQLMYDVGTLLSTGRNDGSWGGNATGASNSAFTIDLNGAAPDIRSTTNMIHSRKYHQLIPFPTGEVLVVGGNTTGVKFADSGSVMEPEVWNPQTGQWRGMANMAVPRDYHSTAMLLPAGRVLTAGGGYDAGNPNSSGTHQDAQIFSPPYLFAADGSLANRPTVAAPQPSVDAGDALQVTTTGDIAYFSLIRMSATTHAVNTDARFYRPEFQAGGANQFSVTVNQNPNVSTPGYWMLFAVDTSGVPSEAQVIRITALDTRLDNLALQGTATQSSLFANNDDFSADKAIDGDLSGSVQAESLTHTLNESEAWWELDLGRVVDIDTIRIWNRTDCCSERLSDFHVLVSSQPFTSEDLNSVLSQSDVFDFPTNDTAGRQTDVKVAEQGRYIRVQLSGANPLQLAEVQVFGALRSDIDNLAVGGTATQSSTFQQNNAFNAGQAIDGSTASGTTDITHTNNDTNAWWELDLGRIVNIDSVVVWNRTNCCSDRLSDFHVLVSDQPFNSKSLDSSISQGGVLDRFIAGAPDDVTEVVVGRSGRYVRVQLNGTNYLHLAEVQVLGSELEQTLNIQPLSVAPQQRGSEVTFAANAAGNGLLQYRWNFGDGNLDTPFRNSPSVTHTFAEPGRYVVSLTVRDSSGEEIRSTVTQIIHPEVQVALPKASRGILEHSTESQVWNVNPDNNTVSVLDTGTLSLLAEIPVGASPVSLAEAPDGNIWVVNRQSASVSVVSASSLSVVNTFALQRASQPYGIVIDDTSAYVALQAVGTVQRLALNGAIGNTADVGANPRHLALNAAADKLYVSRYITDPLPGEESANVIVDDGTQKFGGEVLVLNPQTFAELDTIVLEHINRIPSEHEGPGVPNYLGPVVISPAGDTGWLPSKQDNILGGQLRGRVGITFDQTVRAITSKLDLVGNTEELFSRVDHDNASVAGSSAFDPLGVTLFTSLEGNRQVSVIDVNTGIEIGRFDTGRAPQNLVVSQDGARLYVHNFLDRSIGVFNVEDITVRGTANASEIATVNVVSNETLGATVLRGKQLFYDARDDRLAGLDYMSCASCHVDGEHDGRTWDFTSVGEGLRNTITLKGRAGLGHGILHWTGNFDELQDFEGQIREFAGGTGLMEDSDFAATAAPLGPRKTGLSSDLDAMAAYISSLDRVDESPWKEPDGSLSAAAINGQAVFAAKGCAECHSNSIFTDSNTAALNDIGSIMSESGQRLGGPLSGFDTPTLLGVWRTAPYLHDGSAPTLEDAIAAHTEIDMTAAEQSDLASYLIQLDQGEPPLAVVQPVAPPAAASSGFSNPLGNSIVVIDGDASEWSTIASFGNDAEDITGAANTIDFAQATMAHNDTDFFISYANHSPVSEGWGYGIYIDTDNNTATGFNGFSAELPIGADYLIEGRVVQKYTGTGNDWSWSEVASALYADSGNTAELAIPRSLLGNPSSVRLFFLGNNAAVGGDAVDYYPDGVIDLSAADSDRVLTYTIAGTSGNIPPVAAAQSLRVDQNGQLAITLAGSDLNGDTLLYEVVDQPANGTLSGTAPNVVYTPTTDFVGIDSFSFTVSDNAASSAAATVSIGVTGAVPNNQASITVDGTLGEWASIRSFGADPVDAFVTGDQIDWLQGWVAHNTNQFFFAYENNNPIDLSWGYGLYFDTDNSVSSGFRNFDGSYPIGVDYIFEANELLRYTGTGTDWSWVTVAEIDVQINGNTAEFALQREMLGNPTNLNLFYVGENAAHGGPTIDYYPDDAVTTGAPLRFFSYDTADLSVNVKPVANAQTLVIESGTTTQIALSATDANGDALTYQITRQPPNGALGGVPPNVQYTPRPGFSGADSFEFRALDGALNSDPAVVTITVPGSGNGSNAVAALSVDGGLQDWSGLTPLASDAADLSGGINEIDWRQAYIAHSPTLLYLAYQNDQPIVELSYGHAAFISTDDSDATGFKGFSADLPFGADFLLEGTDLYRYAGSGNNWLWTYVATVDSEHVGSIAEFGISRALLDDPAAIEIFWRGDNEAVNGTGIDFYPDAAGNASGVAAERRFRYELQP